MVIIINRHKQAAVSVEVTLCTLSVMSLCCDSTGLMGLLEKRRFRNFLIWANDFNEADPKTFKGVSIMHVPNVSHFN